MRRTLKKTFCSLKIFLCKVKVPLMLKIPHGTIDANKEPLFLRVNITSNKCPWLFCCTLDWNSLFCLDSSQVWVLWPVLPRPPLSCAKLHRKWRVQCSHQQTYQNLLPHPLQPPTAGHPASQLCVSKQRNIQPSWPNWTSCHPAQRGRKCADPSP